jgi:hypothetical protein
MNRRLGLALSSTALAVLGTAVGAGVATAAPAAGSSVQAPLGSACRTHNPPGGGSVTVCRTWTPDGQGKYNGTWKITNQTGGAYAQGRFDVLIGNLGSTGSFAHVGSFVTRGCHTGCTDWS